MKKRVVIVERDAAHLRLFRRVLGGVEGVEVVTPGAATGASELAAAVAGADALIVGAGPTEADRGAALAWVRAARCAAAVVGAADDDTLLAAARQAGAAWFPRGADTLAALAAWLLGVERAARPSVAPAAWRACLAAVAAPVLVLTEAGEAVFVNPAAAAWLGWPAASVEGQRVWETLLALEDRAHVEAAALASAWWCAEARWRTARGERRVRLSGQPWEGEPYQIVTLEDRTHVTQVEGALQAADAQLQTALERCASPAVILDADQMRIAEVNTQALQLWGRGRSEVHQQLPMGLSMTLTGDGEGAREFGRARIREALAGEVVTFDWAIRHASGEVIPCLARMFSLPAPEGARRLWVELKDLRPQREQEQRHAQQVQALEARIADLDRFTAIAAHDLRAPLLTIRGNLQLLEEDMAAGAAVEVREDLDELKRATASLGALMDDLLQLARSGRASGVHGWVSLEQLALDIWARLGAEGELTVQAGVPPAYGERARLAMLFQNLLENASKFRSSQPLKVLLGHRGGDTWFLQDNGVGVRGEDQGRLFQYLERLRPEVEGTGIGLMIARRVVEAHRGRIWVESEGEGRGTTFCFTLPAPSVGSTIGKDA